MGGFQVSIDTGGTFTDAVIAQPSGAQSLGKALTTEGRISRGVRAAIEAAAAEMGIGLSELLAETDLLVYGTTAATNAIVTRDVARTALLFTEGFEDVLLFREGGKQNAHDFATPFPKPYIPRRHTFSVRERIDAEGGIVRPLDEDHLRATLRKIADRNFEAVAVCLLFSVVNPVHERRVGELVAETLPSAAVSLSHELLPILREFRRASATAPCTGTGGEPLPNLRTVAFISQREYSRISGKPTSSTASPGERSSPSGDSTNKPLVASRTLSRLPAWRPSNWPRTRTRCWGNPSGE